MYLRRRVALIIEKRGKYLLALHAFNFRYGLIGGGVRFGESLENALRREVKEELSCSVKSAKKLFSIDSWLQRHEVFSVKLKGKLRKNWEIKELKWVSRRDLEKMSLNPSTKKIFGKLFNWSNLNFS